MMKLTKGVAVLALTTTPLISQAATFNFTGELTVCEATCSIFSAVGLPLTASFDINPDPMAGDTLTDGGAASNIVITLASNQGGQLDFVNGSVDAINATTDTNGITGGTVTITGTGSTTGLVATSVIDITAGTFVASVGGTEVAEGTGSFGVTPLVGAPPPPPPPIPVPAAAWLFGSALLGLAGVRRRA